ncbi:hypothetical protein J2T60_002144 [Natronospira proteinivora]|uniref:Uncharacterized protein n=1 Tax=Natronospira proteinivora TaxID=1807133 RepID=A0ABT1G9Z4_9GAMM|nr:hypothetical protein [Natronospira proteinivora]MCP1728144.1 hypothetical protein [Natronospira proteinivora]
MDIQGIQGGGYYLGPARQGQAQPVAKPPEIIPPRQSDHANQAIDVPRNPGLGEAQQSLRANTLALQVRTDTPMADRRLAEAEPQASSERLVDTLDRFGVMREPAEQGQLIDTRA